MAPMIPTYDEMDDARLEEVLRERAAATGGSRREALIALTWINDIGTFG